MTSINEIFSHCPEEVQNFLKDKEITYLSFSPDEKYILIRTDIPHQSSTGEQILLIDLIDMNVIYREEIWSDTPHRCECCFDVNSNFIMTYYYELFKYKEFCVDDENIDIIKEMMVTDGVFSDTNIDYKDIWKSGLVEYITANVKVTRKVDPDKITPASSEKWKEKKYDDPNHMKFLTEHKTEYMSENYFHVLNQLNREYLKSEQSLAYKKKYEEDYCTKYGTLCTINEMTEISVVESDNYYKIGKIKFFT